MSSGFFAADTDALPATVVRADCGHDGFSRCGGGLHGSSGGEVEAGLFGGQAQIDFGEELRVKQRAVQAAVAVIDAVVFAERVQIVFGNGDFVFGELQGISEREAVFEFEAGFGEFEFAVKEGLIERHVVRDELIRAIKIGKQIFEDSGKGRLTGDAFVGDAVHTHRVRVNALFGVDVLVKVVFGRAAVDEFDAADFYDAVTFGFVTAIEVHAGGFGIEDDLAHGISLMKSGEIFGIFVGKDGLAAEIMRLL